MKLTSEDLEDLTEMGYPESDFHQIKEAALSKNTKYTLYENNNAKGKRISGEEAIRLLGRRVWLTGLGRSAFHWSASRTVEGTQQFVLFDSHNLFADWK